MNTLSGKPISKIGIGSYGIGGRGHRTMEITEKVEDKKYLDTLVYCLQQGLNFTELSMGYGHGQAMKLFAEALSESKIDREDIFITNSLYPIDLDSIEIINDDIASFYKIFGTDYADSTLVTQSLFAKFDKEIIYNILDDLLTRKMTRYVSLSNAGPNTIKEFRERFGDKFIAHEGHISFEVRALQDAGVFGACDELNVTNNIWRPLRRNMTAKHDWPILVELSGKYGKTQNQIILNWICKLGYHPMVMSSSINHMQENIESTDFNMKPEEYSQITDFRPNNYNPPHIDWNDDSQGDMIVTLVKDFEIHEK